MRPHGLLLAAALLAGCATTTPPRRVALDATCVTSIQGLQAYPVPVSTPEQKKPAPFIDFADVGQCMASGASKMAAALFDLRMVRPPVLASITIQANSAATLATAITLLDSQRTPIRRVGFNEFVRRGDSFTLDVFVNRSDRDAAYLLLTPDAAWVGKADVSVRGGFSTMVIPVGVGVFAFNKGFEARTTRQLTDAGKLRIEIKATAQ